MATEAIAKSEQSEDAEASPIISLSASNLMNIHDNAWKRGNMTITEALERLSRSTFRARFTLTKTEREYVREKGMDVIRRHAEDFVRQKLAPAEPVNDGKQTPMRGHPAFKAMHATACCCRGCLNKWYKVPLHKELNADEQEKIVNLLMAWIERKTDESE